MPVTSPAIYSGWEMRPGAAETRAYGPRRKELRWALDLTDGQRVADPLVPYVVRRRIVHERLVAMNRNASGARRRAGRSPGRASARS